MNNTLTFNKNIFNRTESYRDNIIEPIKPCIFSLGFFTLNSLENIEFVSTNIFFLPLYDDVDFVDAFQNYIKEFIKGDEEITQELMNVNNWYYLGEYNVQSNIHNVLNINMNIHSISFNCTNIYKKMNYSFVNINEINKDDFISNKVVYQPIIKFFSK